MSSALEVSGELYLVEEVTVYWLFFNFFSIKVLKLTYNLIIEFEYNVNED